MTWRRDRPRFDVEGEASVALTADLIHTDTKVKTDLLVLWGRFRELVGRARVVREGSVDVRFGRGVVLLPELAGDAGFTWE